MNPRRVGGVLIVVDRVVKNAKLRSGRGDSISGNAGCAENCQVAWFLDTASRPGPRAARHVPEPWTADRARCRGVGIPEELEFATNPSLATAMLARALQAGALFGLMPPMTPYGRVEYLRR